MGGSFKVGESSSQVVALQIRKGGDGDAEIGSPCDVERPRLPLLAQAALGINCFHHQIYNYPDSILAEKGITAIEHADFEGVERLSLVTGGEIASAFGHPELVRLGRHDLIELEWPLEKHALPCFGGHEPNVISNSKRDADRVGRRMLRDSDELRSGGRSTHGEG